MKHAVLPILITLALAACKPQDPAPLPPEVNAPTPVATTPPTEASAPDAAVDAATTPADTEATPDTAAAPAAVATIDGEAVYKKACITCHGAGIAGAPKLGDTADWGPRIAQGQALLHEHAIKGFTGQKGVMPAKGGFVTLSDEEVKAAVEHMVAGAQ